MQKKKKGLFQNPQYFNPYNLQLKLNTIKKLHNTTTLKNQIQFFFLHAHIYNLLLMSPSKKFLMQMKKNVKCILVKQLDMCGK